MRRIFCDNHNLFRCLFTPVRTSTKLQDEHIKRREHYSSHIYRPFAFPRNSLIFVKPNMLYGLVTARWSELFAVLIMIRINQLIESASSMRNSFLLVATGPLWTFHSNTKRLISFDKHFLKHTVQVLNLEWF